MQLLANPYVGMSDGLNMPEIPRPSNDAATPQALLARCPVAAPTPMKHLQGFGGAGEVFVKDERGRMGLGSFKALGAAYVIAQAAQKRDLTGETFVTASAGNHGLSVAAGAKVFGAKAVVFLSDTVPESFAEKLRGHDAEVVRAGDNYEASMQAALMAASDNGWVLLSDTSWAEYLETPQQLMEGYLVMAAEAVEQIQTPPTHILLQAGVGGLASAAAGYFRKMWGNTPKIIVVEPDAAPALYNSIKAGRSEITLGPVSNMGRLDCKEPSLIALQGLAEDADLFCLISDTEAVEVLPHLDALDLETTPSGAAGLAALFQNIEGIGDESRVLCVLSEASDA